MSSESHHWRFKIKNPALTGILCRVWLYAITKGGRNCEHPSPLPHPAPPKATNSPVLPQKSHPGGVPRVEGTKPTSARMLREPDGYCPGSCPRKGHPCRCREHPGTRITCNEGWIYCRRRIHPKMSNPSKDFRCPACVTARAGAAPSYLCGYGAWGNKQCRNPNQARRAQGIGGVTCKVTRSPPDSYSRSLDGVNAEKRAGYKAGI